MISSAQLANDIACLQLEACAEVCSVFWVDLPDNPSASAVGARKFAPRKSLCSPPEPFLVHVYSSKLFCAKLIKVLRELSASLPILS